MGKSFYLGTDAQLATGAANFSTIIGTDFASLGLTNSQATAYATLNTAWQASYLTAITPETRTKSAVAAKNTQRALIRKMTADLVSVINGIPTVTDEQKINLGIAVRATPTPRPAPGKPASLVVTLDETGVLNLGWKCANPPNTQGTTYNVFRKIAGETEFTYLGGTGERKITDTTLPAGSSGVIYQIQAVRSTAVGPWAQFNVNFGVSSGGAMTASVTETVPTKLAA